MRPVPPAIALFVLTLSIDQAAGRLHGRAWLWIFLLTAALAGSYLIRHRQAVRELITAVTDIIEDHAPHDSPSGILTNYRTFLVTKLADLDRCNPGTPDAGGVLHNYLSVSDTEERLRLAGYDDFPPLTGTPQAMPDIEDVRALLDARLAQVDEHLAKLA